jgi:hypothetical protein
MTIEMEAVVSSLISQRGHDPESQLMRIRFVSKKFDVGSLYEYRNVTAALYAEGCQHINPATGALSFGQWFERQIKSNEVLYPFRKLEDPHNLTGAAPAASSAIVDDEIVEVPLGEIIPPESEAKALFVPNGLDKILALIRQKVDDFKPDVSTEKGRKEIGSFARKIASSKSRLEDYGSNLSMDIKRQAAGIDSERRRMKAELDGLRDRVRKPLTDYEEAEDNRLKEHEDALLAVAELANVPFGAGVVEIEGRLAKLDEFALRPWQEFSARFSQANDAVTLRLGRILQESKERDALQAAFAKSEAERIEREARESAEKVAREQKERDERIAKESADAATKKAEAQRLEVEGRAKAAEQAAADATAKAWAAEKRRADEAAQAERDRKTAAEKAERDKQAAVDAERKRQADAKVAEAAAQAKREANKKHVEKINAEVVEALLKCAGSMPDWTCPNCQWENKAGPVRGKTIAEAIAHGDIPHVTLTY